VETSTVYQHLGPKNHLFWSDPRPPVRKTLLSYPSGADKIGSAWNQRLAEDEIGLRPTTKSGIKRTNQNQFVSLSFGSGAIFNIAPQYLVGTAGI